MEVDGETTLSETEKGESFSKGLSQLNGNTLYISPESFADVPGNPEDDKVISHSSEEDQDFVDAREAPVINTPLTPRGDVPTGQMSERSPLMLNVSEESYQTNIFARSDSWNHWNERSTGLPCYQMGCCYTLQRFSRVFSTPLSLPFYFILMCLAITTGYISAIYIDECPISKYLPSQFLLIAICAVICLTSRILEIMCNWSLIECPSWNILFFIHILTFGSMMLVLIAEVMEVMAITPNVNDVRSSYYCHPFFYNFCYYGSIGSFISIIFLCIFFPGSICVRCGCLCPNM